MECGRTLSPKLEGDGADGYLRSSKRATRSVEEFSIYFTISNLELFFLQIFIVFGTAYESEQYYFHKA